MDNNTGPFHSLPTLPNRLFSNNLFQESRSNERYESVLAFPVRIRRVSLPFLHETDNTQREIINRNGYVRLLPYSTTLDNAPNNLATDISLRALNAPETSLSSDPLSVEWRRGQHKTNLYVLCLQYINEHNDQLEIMLKQLFIRYGKKPAGTMILSKFLLKDIMALINIPTLELTEHYLQQLGIDSGPIWKRFYDTLWSSIPSSETYSGLSEICCSHNEFDGLGDTSHKDLCLISDRNIDYSCYKKKLFEHLFTESRVLRLDIVAKVDSRWSNAMELSIDKINLYRVDREQILYRLRASDSHLSPKKREWSSKWNKYIERLTILQSMWKEIEHDAELQETFVSQIREITLCGFPTDSFPNAQHFIDRILLEGQLEKLVIKFPSKNLLERVLPLLNVRRKNKKILRPGYVSDTMVRQLKWDNDIIPLDIHTAYETGVQSEPSVSSTATESELENKIFGKFRGVEDEVCVSNGEFKYAVYKNPERLSQSQEELLKHESSFAQYYLPANRFNCSTIHTLEIYYIQKAISAAMLCVTLRGMPNLRNLKLSNIRPYSREIEKTILNHLIYSGKLKQLHLLGMRVAGGPVGFLREIFLPHTIDPAKRIGTFSLKSNLPIILETIHMDLIGIHAPGIQGTISQPFYPRNFFSSGIPLRDTQSNHVKRRTFNSLSYSDNESQMTESSSRIRTIDTIRTFTWIQKMFELHELNFFQKLCPYFPRVTSINLRCILATAQRREYLASPLEAIHNSCQMLTHLKLKGIFIHPSDLKNIVVEKLLRGNTLKTLWLERCRLSSRYTEFWDVFFPTLRKSASNLISLSLANNMELDDTITIKLAEVLKDSYDTNYERNLQSYLQLQYLNLCCTNLTYVGIIHLLDCVKFISGKTYQPPNDIHNATPSLVDRSRTPVRNILYLNLVGNQFDVSRNRQLRHTFKNYVHCVEL
ncbi:hypothetical protein SNEBB_000130 [Seison nebaliae]|nr:hypothetical protein SNEBB_000130 [Seison nebaliae]